MGTHSELLTLRQQVVAALNARLMWWLTKQREARAALQPSHTLAGGLAARLGCGAPSHLTDEHVAVLQGLLRDAPVQIKTLRELLRDARAETNIESLRAAQHALATRREAA